MTFSFPCRDALGLPSSFPSVCTNGRTYADVTTKFSCIDRLPNLLTNGAPLLYAKHGTKDAARVVIQSLDNDVLVLSVSHCKEICFGELWFWTGFKDRIRYTPVHKIAARLGAQLAVQGNSCLSRTDRMRLYEVIFWNWKAKCLKSFTQRHKAPRKLSTVRANDRFRQKNRK